MNSYITVSEANDLLNYHDMSEYWVSASVEEREYHLVRATRQINGLESFFTGVKKDKEQINYFPRSTDTDIPPEIKEATAIIAAYLIANKSNKKHKLAQHNGLTSISLNGVAFSYNGSTQSFPEEVIPLLLPFIGLQGVGI